MYLSGDDNLTIAERQRMFVIAERLHWLGLAIQQANVSGNFQAATTYEAEKRTLQAEQRKLQEAAVTRGGVRQEQAGDPFGVLGALKGVALYAGLGLAAYLYFTRGRK
jgi:hypothetical protein